MHSYSSREIIKVLESHGWFLVNVTGSHYQYKHSFRRGRVTVKHPDKDVPMATLKSIERQSGIKFE